MSQKTFHVEYMHQILPDSIFRCYERRSVECVMYRYGGCEHIPQDTFACHRAADDEFLADETCDTKEEAIADARFYLMRQSQAEFRRMIEARGVLIGG